MSDLVSNLIEPPLSQPTLDMNHPGFKIKTHNGYLANSTRHRAATTKNRKTETGESTFSSPKQAVSTTKHKKREYVIQVESPKSDKQSAAPVFSEPARIEIAEEQDSSFMTSDSSEDEREHLTIHVNPLSAGHKPVSIKKVISNLLSEERPKEVSLGDLVQS